MSCNQWNPEWVAQLYGELDDAERLGMERHLEGCPTCRATFEELGASRQLLAESAPVIPNSPPLVVLEPHSQRHGVWAFAAGLACASLLFGAGWLTATRLIPGADSAGPAQRPAASTTIASREPDGPTQAQFDEALAAQQAYFEKRLAEYESRLPGESAEAMPAVLTRDQFEDGMSRLERRWENHRARDMEFVLGEITATEARAGTWVDETRDALRLVALQSDPRVSVK